MPKVLPLLTICLIIQDRFQQVFGLYPVEVFVFDFDMQYGNTIILRGYFAHFILYNEN